MKRNPNSPSHWLLMRQEPRGTNLSLGQSIWTTGKDVFITWVVKLWNKLHRIVVESLSVVVMKIWLSTILQPVRFKAESCFTGDISSHKLNFLLEWGKKGFWSTMKGWVSISYLGEEWSNCNGDIKKVVEENCQATQNCGLQNYEGFPKQRQKKT